MASIKEKVRLVISSRDKLVSTQTTSDFTITINKPIRRISSMQIESISIPFSFYIIDNTMNSLELDNSGVTIQIPPGNYTAVSLCSAVKQALDTAYAEVTTVTFSPITGFVTISKPSAFNIMPTGLAIIMGFTDATHQVSNTQHTATVALNLSGPPHLAVVSDFLTKPINTKIRSSRDPSLPVNTVDIRYDNVLAVVPITSPPGGVITLDNAYNQEQITLAYSLDITQNDVIDITIYNPVTELPVDLNGLDVDIVITFMTY